MMMAGDPLTGAESMPTVDAVSLAASESAVASDSGWTQIMAFKLWSKVPCGAATLPACASGDWSKIHSCTHANTPGAEVRFNAGQAALWPPDSKPGGCRYYGTPAV